MLPFHSAVFSAGPPMHQRSLAGIPGEAMTLIWYADGARVTEPDNFNRRRDLERWMPGLKPGDLAASELNPLVFRR